MIDAGFIAQTTKVNALPLDISAVLGVRKSYLLENAGKNIKIWIFTEQIAYRQLSFD